MTNIKRQHLITTQDWSLAEIDDTLELARQIRDCNEPAWMASCLDRRTVTLLFDAPSTRSRILLHIATVEMGGVPLTLNDTDLHSGEDFTDLTRVLLQSNGAICVRMAPTEQIPYGKGEEILRRMSASSDAASGPPVISMSHDQCHPCQGLSELLTYREAMGGDLRGKRIVFTWTRGKRSAPASPTQDSLMIATRMGMDVTLCHPPGWDLDDEVMGICRRNAAECGAVFNSTNDLRSACQDRDIVYARHWGPSAIEAEYDSWYCDQELLGKGKYIHPMPVEREVEVSSDVVDGAESLTRELIRNKHVVQKAVLARLVRLRKG